MNSPIPFAEEYAQACATPSDINELLPVLLGYASQCAHITEFGIRAGVSTRAFFHAAPKRLRSYDLKVSDDVEQLFLSARAQGFDYRCIQADVLEVEIEPTDMLFIDTFHAYEQTAEELRLHAGKVSRFIAFHDVETYGYEPEKRYGKVGTRGIMPAIREFLAANPAWSVDLHLTYNNGLLVIEMSP